MAVWTIQQGDTRCLGATVVDGGVNFALVAPSAAAVQLCLFDAVGEQEIARLSLPAAREGVWAGCVPDCPVGMVYGWRVYGPWNPQAGQRFNPAKVLLDPNAREVVGRYQADGALADWYLGHQPGKPLLADGRDNAALALKARVVSPVAVPRPLQQRIDPSQRVVYELHVKGFTALHAAVPAHLRGTYAGLAHPAAIAHLVALGITTVSVLPVAHRADEERLQQMGLSNYWGYSPIAWCAPEARYWSGQPGTTVRGEFSGMVDALHAAGIEVILDVVYNHTAETDELGPTLSLRGIDNALYYHLRSDQPAYYENWTGCGNCVNADNPWVLRLVMDSLRVWVQEMGVDGFRFDLAPVMARSGVGTGHAFSQRAAFLQALAQDPVLRDCLLVAEPWDIGPGGYQLGAFPTGWLEWNDKFRDTQRAFWLQHSEPRGVLANRLAGSSEVFASAMRGPHSSVNFVTAHDGFTLEDLVSYTHRYNFANGENNRDGHAHNLSVNCGVEGRTDRLDVQQARLRHKRALLAVTVLSLGTPMLLAGDEFGHTQMGNNNAYCQDNPTTWLHWDRQDVALLRFTQQLLALRRKHSVLQARHWWQAEVSSNGVQGQWFAPSGAAMDDAAWWALGVGTGAGALALVLRGPQSAAQPSVCLVLINAHAHACDFQVPTGAWERVLDTYDGDCSAVTLPARVSVPPGALWVAHAIDTM